MIGTFEDSSNIKGSLNSSINVTGALNNNINLESSLSSQSNIVGSIGVNIITSIQANKDVTPNALTQTITPDSGYDYLEQVTVAPIPYIETQNEHGTTVTIAGV